MIRCIFVGPSLHGIEERPSGIDFRPPAAMGDVMRAVQDGFEWIGLVDGLFGTCASVWHKEILYALANGCLVSGAASMGALRAAECHAFGMLPVGAIAEGYIAGELIEDADVALVHGPVEVDYLPLSEPLVDVEATLDSMRLSGIVPPVEAARLLASARAMHFTERSLDRWTSCAIPDPTRREEIAELYERNRVRRKQADALLLVREMSTCEPPSGLKIEWELSRSASLARLSQEKGIA